MFGEDQNKDNDRGPKKPPGGFKLPLTTWVAWIAIIGSIAALMLLKNHMTTGAGTLLSQAEFFKLFQSNLIAQATVSFNPQTAPLTEITGQYYQTDKDGKKVEVPFVVKNVYLTQAKQDQLFASDKIDASQPNTMLMSVVWGIAPFLLIGILFWFFFIRQI